jgi:hypothetical protein
MADPNPDKNLVRVDPGTLLLVTVAVLLIPLLIAGFFSH